MRYILLISLVLLAGCSTSREQAASWTIAPIQTPMGVVGPISARQESSEVRTVRVDPVVLEAGGSVLSGVLGVVGGPVGIASLLAGGLGLWRARRSAKQRDEVIAGNEEAFKDMPADIAKAAKLKMATVQSEDTQRAVWEKT